MLLCLSLSVVEYQAAVLRGNTEVAGQDNSSVTKTPTQFRETHGTSIFFRLLLLPPLTLVSTNFPTPISRGQSASIPISTDPEQVRNCERFKIPLFIIPCRVENIIQDLGYYENDDVFGDNVDDYDYQARARH